jgi:hypothetical protein
MLVAFKTSISLTSLAIVFLVCSLPVKAAIAPIGEVIVTNGPFIAIQPGTSARSLTRGSEFYQGDRLWTGPRTKAQIRFTDGAIMTLRPDTEFSVDEYEFDKQDADKNKSLFTLIKGGFRTLTGLISQLRPDSYKVKTAYAIVGVRGTTYEVVDQAGLHAAAWQGKISLTNDKDELVIGFGQDYSYARVASFNSRPVGALEIPAPLQETVDPGLQEPMVDPTETRLTTGLLQDGLDARLTAAEAASIDRKGFATFGGTTLSGIANDGAGGSPIVFDLGTDAVLRQAAAPLSNGPNTPVAGVSWGLWNGTASPASLQPDAANPSFVQPVNSEVFWLTMVQTPLMPATGVVGYTLVAGPAGSAATGNLPGPATVTSFNATVNFGAAQLSGTMAVNNSPNLWNTSFSGTLAGATFNASLDASSKLNAVSDVTGTVQGAFSGANAGTMGGVFDFRQVGDPSTFVNGVFVAQ